MKAIEKMRAVMASKDTKLAFDGSIPLPFPFYLKKLLHQLTALRFQNAFDYFNAMIQVRGVTDLKMGLDRAGPFVRSSVNQQPHARLN